MFPQPPPLTRSPRWVYDDPSGLPEPGPKQPPALARGLKARLHLVRRPAAAPARPKAA